MAYYSPLAQVRNRISTYASPLSKGGLTQAQKELRPYVQEEKKKKDWKKRLLQPIEIIFDLLQRGQYVTANVTEQIARNVKNKEPFFRGVGREAWQGLTGKDKGDWANVIFGGQDVGGEEFEGLAPNYNREKWEKPILGEKFRGKPIIGATPKGIVGTAANILLDPTTYINPTAATGARAAAKSYAADAALLAIKKYAADPSVLAKIARKGGKEAAEEITEAAAKSIPDAIKLVQKYGGIDMARHMESVVKTARKEALRQPSKVISKKMLEQVSEVRRPAQKAYEKGISSKIAEVGDEIMGLGETPAVSDYVKKTLEEYMGEKASKTGLKYLDDLTKSIEGGRYAGAGQRAIRSFGKEWAVGERYPQVLKTWDKLQESFQKSKIGGVFSDAWWSVMNKGPVGQLKKMFGVRNPYQEILSQMVRDAQAGSTNSIINSQKALLTILKPLKDDEAKAVRELMIGAQGQMVDFRRLAAESGIAGESVEKVASAIENINKITSAWRKELDGFVESGIIKQVGDIENYLPIRRKGSGFYKRAATPISAKHLGQLNTRTLGFAGNIQADAAQFAFLFPEVKPEILAKMIKGGAGNLETDLYQMLMGYSMAHARLRQRANLVTQFREFGFNMQTAAASSPELQKLLSVGTTNIESLGLKTLQDEALSGYFFDRDIADILNRALNVTASDESIRRVQEVFNSFTSWWKAWATASPGFHFRNHYSNNFVGLMKHGGEWLNPKENYDAWVGTIYALNRKDALKELVGEGIDETTATMILKSTAYGGKSVEELARYAANSAVISPHVMGFDAPQSLEEVLKKGQGLSKLNPFSTEFGLLQKSYGLSTYVENVSKFHSFLLDYRRAIKQGVNPETAMEYAKFEAKKWFFDYADLSDFEKAYLKPIIPFYTFMRKAIATQMEGMIDYRDMYSMVPKIFKGEGLEKENIPDWMVDAGYVPIGEPNEEGKINMFWPNLPHMEINKIPLKFAMSKAGIPMPVFQGNEILRDVVGSAHPLIKTAIEVVGKRDVFYDKELDDNLASPRMMRVLTERPEILGWVDGLLRIAGSDRGLDPSLDDQGRLTINPYISQVLDNNVLFLKRLPQYWDLPERILPALEEIKQKKLGAKGDYEEQAQDLEEMFQILSFYLGIKMKELDVKEQKQFEALDTLRAAEKERSRDKKQMPGSKKRSLDYVKSTVKRAKRTGAF